ncbi:MAG: diheme cytochrome c [Gammaproteobacteria bacterium]|nr:diheme cytochrome c [Gammaproteobacteria bacterium]
MKLRIVFQSLLVLLLMAVVIPCFADDDDHSWRFWKGERSHGDVAAVNNTLYKKECGECHFAYQPGLLPSASWQKIMTGLNNHFGDNAELDPEDAKSILSYLQLNAADVVGSKFAGWARGTAPLRITEMSKFRHEHDELPRAILSKNSQVKSLSNCIACHTGADAGSFDENQIKIPGIGRWDD